MADRTRAAGSEASSGETLAPHPEPPTDLGARRLPIFDPAAAPQPWCRLHRLDREPIFFGRSARGRFNPPAGEFGVLYLAADPFGAFVETLGQSTGISGVAQAVVATASLSRVSTTRPLRLVDLTGAGLARIGADARLCTGDHALALRWSAALWVHPTAADGLIYRARHDPDRLVMAIFDRAADAIVVEETVGLLGQPAQLAEFLDRYGFALIPG